MTQWQVLVVAGWLAIIMPQTALGQIAVYDGANHSANLYTGFQSAITAVEAVLQSGYMLLELEPFRDTGLGTMGLDLDELDAIIRDGQGILFDLQTIKAQTQRLFDLQGAPTGTLALWQRVQEIRIARVQAQAKARDIQTLPRRICNVTARMRNLLARILGVVGQKQSSQQVQAMLQQITYIESQSQVIEAGFNQAVLTDMAERPLVEEAMTKIHEQVLADWPQ